MSSPIKILHVVLSLECGGLERIVVDLIRHARGNGHRADVLCLVKRGVLANEAEAMGAKVVCLDKQPGIRLNLFGKIRRAICELRPDVIHCHQVGALFYVGAAARLAGVGAVLHTEHNNHYQMRRRNRWLGRIAGAFASRIVCVSGDVAAQLEANHIVPRRKIHVVPNGIETARFATCDDAFDVRASLGISRNARVVGSIGRLTDIKRQDVLLRAFADVHMLLPDAHLILVGDGPLMPKLRELAAQPLLKSFVHLVGYQSQPARYLHAMNIFAQTSQVEGMPLAVLEAWAAGLPVLASRVGGLAEMMNGSGAGVLFEADDYDALRGSLITLLKDSELSRRMGDAGRSHVRLRYDVQRMAADYEAHYRALLRSQCDFTHSRVLAWMMQGAGSLL